jgi:hypothetical protein
VIFVDRERETERLFTAFEAGRNAVLSGKFGSGRTALLRHLGELAPDRFRVCFADFGSTPATVCRSLATTLLPDRRRSRSPGSREAPWGRPQRSGGRRRPRYAELVTALAGASWPSPPLTVVVLDDLSKLTAAKLELLGRLAVNRSARWVVVVEPFLPRQALIRLTARLHPTERLHVDRLSASAARRYFRLIAEEAGLPWGEEQVEVLARSSGGYPLAMRQIAERKARRRPPSGPPASDARRSR